MNFREHYKEQIREILEGKSLEEAFVYCTGVGDKTEILWSTNDLLKSDEIPLDLAVRVAEHYYKDEDPLPGDRYDTETRTGDDVRFIASVRATVCWLLLTILGKLDTSYYPRVMAMIEHLCLVSTESNTYVRRNAAIPLSSITRNLRAKQNSDGTPFQIDEGTKAKAVTLAYQMLKENADLPRVLEYVVSIFDGMRDIREEQAMLVLRTLFYKPDGETLHPEYLTRGAAPLAIFYAEFRSRAFNDGFDDRPFKVFLKQLIEKSGSSDHDLLATIVWHFWKSIKDDGSTLPILSPYFSLLFEHGITARVSSQLEFLANEVVEDDFESGVPLYNQYLDNLIEIIRRDKQAGKERGYMAEAFNAGQVLIDLQKKKPESVPQLIRKLTQLVYEGVYVGHIDIFAKEFAGLSKETQGWELTRVELNKLINAFGAKFRSELKEVDA